jgi:hypothetical protein
VSHDIIEGAANWRAEEMRRRTDWIHDFTAVELAELDAALAAVHRRGSGIEDVTSAAQFPLERLAERIDHARWMLEEGPGLFHFRGIDTARNGGQFDDSPPLTGKQVEAMDHFDSVACSERFHFSMMFEPGDIQLLNNHVCVHSRTHFEDFPELDRRRHLLRMWLSVPNSRELSQSMGTIYRDQGSGAVRGGFPTRSGRHVYETAAPVD